MRRKWNRPLAALLAACMLFSLLPAAAAVETVEEPDNSYSAPLPAEPAPAEDGDETQGNPETEQVPNSGMVVHTFNLGYTFCWRPT